MNPFANRGVVVASAVALVAVVATAVGTHALVTNRGEADRSRAQRLDRHCDEVRHTLDRLKRDLEDPTASHREMGQAAFVHIVMNDWHEVNLCMPQQLPVASDDCEGHMECLFHGGIGCKIDRSCMLFHASWALALTR